jgi:hypothetical protein
LGISIEVEHADDVGVIQIRGDLRLALETLDDLEGHAGVGQQDLERQRRLGSQMPNLVHLSHRAAADGAHHPVGTGKDRAGGERGRHGGARV